MGNVNNGEEDKDGGSWTEEKGFYAYAHSRGSRNVGCQGEITGNQPERTYRANSAKSSIFGSGTPDDGGIICQLIRDYRDQVAERKAQVAARKAEIKHLEDEAEKLEFRIQEFEALKKQLEQQCEKVE